VCLTVFCAAQQTQFSAVVAVCVTQAGSESSGCHRKFHALPVRFLLQSADSAAADARADKKHVHVVTHLKSLSLSF